jgi:hypothetical protein
MGLNPQSNIAGIEYFRYNIYLTGNINYVFDPKEKNHKLSLSRSLKP